jgi:hypothetical protein
MDMDEEDWKGIIDELLAVNQKLTLELAVSRKDVKRLVGAIEDRNKTIEEYNSRAEQSAPPVEVHKITDKE